MAQAYLHQLPSRRPIPICRQHPSPQVEIYLFQNSKNEFGVQISDVIIGLIGKIFSYLTTSSNEDINQLKNKLSQLNCKNLSLLRQLILSSEKTNKAFLHTLISDNDRNKLSILLS